MVPYELPSQDALQAEVADLPLVLDSYLDEPELYIAVLHVPHRYALPGGPLQLQVRSSPWSRS
jgi:hypothetical protein